MTLRHRSVRGAVPDGQRQASSEIKKPLISFLVRPKQWGAGSKRAVRLGTSVSLTPRPHQFLRQNKQAFNMLVPAEVASTSEAIARQFFRQLRRFLHLQYPFCQRIRRETRE